ncbi:DUF3795 domain-containing protein [bacterium]|nr:DUF3795 domain-containing protein [bacterium]
MATTLPFTRTLITPCGMNCGICHAYLERKGKCPGCNAQCDDPPQYFSICFMRNCTKRTKQYCSFCDEFPCKKLKQIDKRYRKQYGMSMIENLNYIKDHGIRAFLKSEAARWTCQECGGIINVHKHRCSACGAFRP